MELHLCSWYIIQSLFETFFLKVVFWGKTLTTAEAQTPESQKQSRVKNTKKWKPLKFAS